MQLFTRTVHMTGPPADVAAFSTEMCAHVTKTVGQEVSLWNVQFGAPVGTMVYGTQVEGLAHLQTITDALSADAKYHELVAKGAQFQSTPAEDSLSNPLHGGDNTTPIPVGAVASSTQAVIAGGAYVEGVAWSVDMATHIEKVTGNPVAFYMDAYGTFGSVRWVGVVPDAATVDADQAALNADTQYLEKLAVTGDLFVPASGNRQIATRIA